ncbi:MAG: BamA/TamA family outer membrane protein [Myxococcota bacterium]
MLVGASARADLPAHPCPGVPIARATIVGCDADRCRAHAAIARLVATLPLRGDAVPLADMDLLRLSGELVATRLVSAPPTYVCEGDQLYVTVVPQTFVRKVTLDGNDVFHKKDLMKRVFLRPGTPLTLDPARPMENEDVARQVDSLLRLYRQAGLDTAQIKAGARLVSPTELDLELTISEGARNRVDTVEAHHIRKLSGAASAGDGGDLHCPTITERRLERLTGLEAGDVVTRLTERKIKEKVRKAFQAAGYVRPDIDVAPAPDEPQRLEVMVTTEHCWVVRVWERDLATAEKESDLSFRWKDPLHLADPDGSADFRHDALDDWQDVLPFGESGSFELDEATRGVDAVAREIRARGYPFADVQLIHRELPRDAGGPHEVVGTIDYLITLNLPRRIEAVRFEGNRALSDETLRGLIKSKAYDFFGSPGAFDEARAFADLHEIQKAYVERGYLAMRFADRAPVVAAGAPALLERDLVADEPDRVVWRYTIGDMGFRLEKAKSDLHLSLIIGVEEGPATRVASFTASGVTLLTPAEVASLTGLGHGRPFGAKPLADGLDRLTRYYQARGHHRLKVDVTCRLAGAPDPVPCDAASLVGKGDVDLALAVSEGPPIKVGAVVWRGNAETDPHVLVRDLPKRGDLLDLERVNRAVRKMRSLGIYNSVRVDVLGLDQDHTLPPEQADLASDEVVLVVSVEETGYRFLDVAAGLRSIQRSNIGRVPRAAADGAGLLVDQADRVSSGFGRAYPLDIPDILVTMELEYLDLDISGLGNQLRLPFTAGFSLSQFLRLATFDPSLTFPRLLDSTVTLTTRIVAELDRVTDPLDRLEIGAEADASVPLSREMLAGITARAGVIQLEEPEGACVYCLSGPPVGWSTSLPQDLADRAASEAACAAGDSDACSDKSFRPQLTLTLRWRWDRQDTPLHPTHGIVLAAATSYILDRDRNLASQQFNQFVKWEASFRGALGIGPLILAGFARYGGSATFGQPFLPADERYTLGGSNGMRGFVDNGVCRYDRHGNLMADCATEFGGNVIINGSLELRVPLLGGFWLASFLDIGALAESHAQLYPASFRFGAGIGVRYLLGGLFPIRLDFGFPIFQRRCVAFTSEGQCVLEDPSQVHFDLLYTF